MGTEFEPRWEHHHSLRNAEFWKSINNHWNIEQFKGLNCQQYQNKKLSFKNQFSNNNNNNNNSSMKTSVLWNQKDGAGVKPPSSSAVVESPTSSTSGVSFTQQQQQHQQEEYPRWRQMMLNPDTQGAGKLMPRVRQRASSLNDRLTTQKHHDYNKAKQHENIENIEKYSFINHKNNQKLNHTNKQSMPVTITGAGANLNKIKTNDPPDSSASSSSTSTSQPSHRIHHQSRSHQNGVSLSIFIDLCLNFGYVS
ncbi:unnamed protein product [Trichobilharzia regenti]|nr:unnamed protein product [Trichobilharzia regenti]